MIAFCPTRDTRNGLNRIISRSQGEFPAHSITDGLEIATSSADARVVGIDEAHFFRRDLITAVYILVNGGKRVIVCGLDMDYLKQPFEVVAHLMAQADEVTKLSAVCVVCGETAILSQKLTKDGQAAPRQSERLVVGDIEPNNQNGDYYEPRCRNCHVVLDL